MGHKGQKGQFKIWKKGGNANGKVSNYQGTEKGPW